MVNKPTDKQKDYLAYILNTSRLWEVEQFVSKVVDKPRTKVRPHPLTRRDYSAAINKAHEVYSRQPWE